MYLSQECPSMWRPRDGRNDGRVNREPRRPPRATGSRADVMGRVCDASQSTQALFPALPCPSDSYASPWGEDGREG